MQMRSFDIKKERIIKKESRSLLKVAGYSIFLFLLLFDILKDIFIMPVIRRIWSFTLMTTPDGFISNTNILNTLIKSPWIVPIGIALILIYAVVSIWQVCAVFLGVAYVYQGKKFKIIDLLKISAKEVYISCRPENWMMLVYTLIVVPFADIYQTNEMIGAFVIPEYIAEFIFSNVALSLLLIVLFIMVVYIALRWFYILPSFILKKHSFKYASQESFEITKKGYFRKAISLAIYNYVETIRFSLIPFGLIFGGAFVCYYFTKNINLSDHLFRYVVIEAGSDLAKNIVGSFVYISIMCFLFASYVGLSGNENVEFNIPALPREAKKRKSVMGIEIMLSVLAAMFVCVMYLLGVMTAKFAPESLADFFKPTAIVAHKGYSSKAPENTMPAFELADKSDNVDYIELDVWSSKDGIPVVLHNESIAAATGLDGEVYDYTYEELQKIPAPYDKDANEFEDARIPSLEEVLATYAASTPILIEIKGYGVDEYLPAKIVDLMDKYNCKYTSMIHSGNYQALKAVKECDPDIKCGLIQAIVTGDCYDLPYADFLSVEHTFVNRNMVSQLHKRGKEIYVWTINYDESADDLKLMGVNGLITDYPDDIAEYVEAQNSIFKDSLELQINNGIKDIQSEFEKGNY